MRHVIVFVGEGPASAPRCTRTLNPGGQLFELVMMHENDRKLMDEAAMDRFVARFPVECPEDRLVRSANSFR